MFLAVTAIVFPTAIIVFFMEEFQRLFERLFAIPGLKLILPLLSATLLLNYFEPEFSILLAWLKFIFGFTLYWLAKVSPLKAKAALSLVLILTTVCLSIVLIERRKKKRAFVVYHNDWVLHFLLWSLLITELSFLS